MENDIKKCKDCTNHLKPSCPFFMGLDKRTSDIISENGKIEFGVNCFQSEEDKWLCDLMCGYAEEE